MSIRTNWYAIYTKSKAEKSVFQQLVNLGYETYLPIIIETRRRTDRTVNVEAPLFRSYLFVKINEKQYSEIPKLIRGFVKFITIGGEKIVVKESEIETIKKFIQYDSNTLQTTNETFTLNELVEFKQGVLKGVKGNLVELRGKYKFAIRIESMGTSLLVETSRNFVKKVAEVVKN